MGNEIAGQIQTGDGGENKRLTEALIREHQLVEENNELASKAGRLERAVEALTDAMRVLMGKNEWTFNEGSARVYVETTKDLPHALWKRLKMYVDLIEPTIQEEGETKDGVITNTEATTHAGDV